MVFTKPSPFYWAGVVNVSNPATITLGFLGPAASSQAPMMIERHEPFYIDFIPLLDHIGVHRTWQELGFAISAIVGLVVIWDIVRKWRN